MKISDCWASSILGDPGAVSEGKSKWQGKSGKEKLERKQGAPQWGQSLTAPGLNSSVNAGFQMGRKNPLYYSAQLVGSRSTVRFVCSNTKPTQKLVGLPYMYCLFREILLENVGQIAFPHNSSTFGRLR